MVKNKKKKRWTENRCNKQHSVEKQQCNSVTNIDTEDFLASAKGRYEYLYDYSFTIETFNSYVKSDFAYFYRNFYCKPTFTQHYYDERRKFLSLFFEHEDRGIQILSYTFALPVKAFRSFLWEQNVDMQDLQSYVRRMTDEQLTALKNAYWFLNIAEVLPTYCEKGWKYVSHKPSLIEIKDESAYDESERFQQNWTILKTEIDLGMNKGQDDDFLISINLILVKIFAFLGMGYTKFTELSVDFVNVSAPYVTPHNGNKQYFINLNGIYGIATRKIYGNYLWGDFEKQKVGGWVCPRFWTTFSLYFMLLLVSPISISIFTFGSIDNSKILLWLGLFGSFLPLLLLAYVLKYSTKKFLEYSTKFLDKFTPMISSFFRALKLRISDFSSTKSGEVFFNIFWHLVYFLVSVGLLNIAYDFFVSVAISGIIYYYIDNCSHKQKFISIYGMRYGKYAVFFLISIHLIYCWEFIVEILLASFTFLLVCFDFLLNYYAHIFVVLFTLIVFYKIVVKAKAYIDIQNGYIKSETKEDIFSLYDKLVTFLYAYMILVIIVACLIMLAEMQSVLIDLKGFLIPFGGFCFCLFSVGFFIAQPPTYLEDERKRYNRGNNLMAGDFCNLECTMAVSNNDWLLESEIGIYEVYKLYESFIPKKDTYFEGLYVEFLNRLDSNFLEQVKLLREMIDDEGLDTNYLYLKKLIRSNMTAEEVINYFEKIDEVESKALTFLRKVWSIVTYPFKRGFYYICRFFTLIYGIYAILIGKFHTICPYANSSQQI